MSIPVLPTTDVKFVAGTIGLFGAAPGAAHLSEFKTFNANPEVTMTTLAGLVQKDAAKLAAIVVANLGLTGAAATAGTAYLTGEFNANPTNHGKVVIDAILTLTTLTADATFGAAATAVTAMVNKGAAFSAVATNTSKDLTVLKAAIAAGETNVGIIGVDTGKFTATNDTVTVSATTLNAGDSFVDPSTLDQDVLTLNLEGNVTNPLLGTRFINIETMAINVARMQGNEAVAGVTNGANLRFDSQTQTTGLKTITVTGDSRGSLGLVAVRDEVTRVDASAMSDDQSDVDGISLTFAANINADGTINTARTILGSQGSDSIQSSAGADTITGGRGNDTIQGGAGNDSIDGGAGNDSIEAGAGNDTVIGGAGDDRVFTNGGADSIDTGDGNDNVTITLAAGGTTATVLTGTGTDFIYVNGATGGVNIDGQNDNDTIFFANGTTVDARNTLEGGAGGVDMFVMADSLNRTIGQNLLNASTGWEVYAFADNANLNGVAETDTLGQVNNVFSLATKTVGLTVNAFYGVDLIAGQGADSITGSDANDTIDGGAGNDTINGGAGNDTIIYRAQDGGADRITFGAGAADTLEAFSNAAGLLDLTVVTLTDAPEVINVHSNVSVRMSQLNAMAANGTQWNFVSTGPHTIAILNDQPTSAGFNLAINNGGSALTITSFVGGPGAANFTLTGGGTTNINGTGITGTVVVGNDNAELITTGGFNDDINGGGGADTISAGAGADTINAGNGADSITGGAGIDRIILTETTPSPDTVTVNSAFAADADTIVGFAAAAGGDVLQFDISDLGLNGADFAAGAAIAATAAAVAALGAGNAANHVIVDTAANILAYNDAVPAPASYAGAALAVASDTGAIYFDADANFTAGAVIIGTVSGFSGALVDANFAFVA